MTAFTYERDLDHPVSAEVEQTIRDVLEGHLTSQGLEGLQVNAGLDHDGDPVLFVHLKFRLVEPGINPCLLSDSAISLRRAPRPGSPKWNILESEYIDRDHVLEIPHDLNVLHRGASPLDREYRCLGAALRRRGY